MSLDCEGKWGMADHLSAHHATVITNRNLARVYSELLRAFERRKLRVTFAFVGAFTMEPEEYRAHPDLFGDSVGAGGKHFLAQPRALPAPRSGLPVAIPPGFFLNWRFGIRRRIPAAVTLTRWKRILDHAAESGGVALVWTHPHNFIDGEGQLELFEAVPDHAAGLIHRELMVNCTQSEYADAVLRRRGIEAHEPDHIVSAGIQ